MGQGANQAFEDVYHLIRVLTKHHKDPKANPSTEVLVAVFREYECLRIERTTALVRLAHERGNVRVILTEAEALERDRSVREKWNSAEDAWAEFDRIACQPYDKVSEI